MGCLEGPTKPDRLISTARQSLGDIPHGQRSQVGPVSHNPSVIIPRASAITASCINTVSHVPYANTFEQRSSRSFAQ